MLIRPATIADISAIARVNVDSWRSTYRGIVPSEFLDGLSYTRQEERNRRYLAEQVVCLVAELPDVGVVGYIRGGVERTKHPDFQTEIYAIYLLEHYQGHGIGSALVCRWCDAQRQQGFTTALVWVLEQNTPAVGFYRHTGARFIQEQYIELGGRQLVEHAYGWDDLNHPALVKLCDRPAPVS